MNARKLAWVLGVAAFALAGVKAALACPPGGSYSHSTWNCEFCGAGPDCRGTEFRWYDCPDGTHYSEWYNRECGYCLGTCTGGGGGGCWPRICPT